MAELQAAFRRRAVDAGTDTAVRDLRVLARHGGHAPARRAGVARRHPLVRSARGLPHRDPRADEGPDGQERGDRARRVEGRLRAAPPADRACGPGGRGHLPLLDADPRNARPDRQPGRRRGRASRRPARVRRRRPVPGRGRRQGHGRAVGRRKRDLGRVRLLARRRVRLGRVAWLRPQGARHHRARGLGERQAPLPRARPRPPTQPFTCTGIGDMSGDVFGNGLLVLAPDAAGGGVRPPSRVHRSRPRPRDLVGRAQAPVRPRRRGLRGRTTTLPSSRPAVACGHVPPSRFRCRNRPVPRSGSKPRR